MNRSRRPAPPLLARWLLLLLVPGLLLSLPAGAGKRPIGEDAPPEEVVKSIVGTFEYASRRLRSKPVKLRERLLGELVDDRIIPWVDWEHMTRQIFVNHWAELEQRGITGEAVEGVTKAFRTRTIRALQWYTKYKIRVFKAQIDGDIARVHIKVDAYNTYGSDVYFHKDEEGFWKVSDFVLVGTSVTEAVRKAVDKGVERYGYDRIFELMHEES